MDRPARRTRQGSGGEGPGLFDRSAGAAGAPAAGGGEGPLYSVSELTREVHERIGGIGRVRVEGEVSGVKRPASGHLYFDLKDEGARLDCKIWRSQLGRALRFELEEGAQVVAHGRLDVYAPRGTYSLLVDRLEPLGLGELLARLERLKAELSGLGWFDRARPLPTLPDRIGVVTSRDGAALRDFLRTRSLRWAGFPVRLAHTPVQGAGAAEEIADALDRLDRSGVDVIVLCRGGGSLEDLWAFNERAVAAAIWRASVPVVSGIGHEVDTTLADLVADHRAHTPTDAAQTVIPDRRVLEEELLRRANYLTAAMDGILERRRDRLREIAGRRALRDAAWILGERARKFLDLHARLGTSTRGGIHACDARLQRIFARLQGQGPGARIERWSRRLLATGGELRGRMVRRIEQEEGRLSLLAKSLQTTSPLAVLGRGYSVTKRRGGGEPLTEASSLSAGDELETRLARGTVFSRVTGSARGDGV